MQFKQKLVCIALSCVMLLSGAAFLISVRAQAPKKAQIVFSSNKEGNSEIFVMDAHGRNVHRITKHSAIDFEPTWSPDGQKIAFVSYRDGNGDVSQIYVMDVNGENQRNLTNNFDMWDNQPAWSPDGKSIAFRRLNVDEIYIMDADGGNQRPLTDGLGIDECPAWSPDGKKIVFASFFGKPDMNREICVMDADGKNIRRLTNNPARDWFPAWSPDGEKIAFVSNRNGRNDIYVIDVDGNNPQNLTNNKIIDYALGDWSADASSISVAPAGKLKGTWGWFKRTNR